MSEIVARSPLFRLDDAGVSLPHVPELNADSIKRLYEDDLAQILLPSAGLKQWIGWGKGALDSDARLNDVVKSRGGHLEGFLRRAAAIAAHVTVAPIPLRFETLAGDSHNGACRPLLFHFSERSMVLKFTDPRPYQLLAQVLDHLSDDIGVDLKMPAIVPDPDNEWYFAPFLRERPIVPYDVMGTCSPWEH